MGFRAFAIATTVLFTLSFTSLFQEPAPITLLLLGTGAAGLGCLVRRRCEAQWRS